MRPLASATGRAHPHLIAVNRGGALIVLITLLAAAPLRAQEASRREGFWLSFGGGYGSNKSDCQNCLDPPTKGGASLFLKLGGTVSPYVLLGMESQLYYRSESGGSAQVGNLSLIGQWYPWFKRGFFAKAGVGLSYAKDKFPTLAVNTTTTIEKMGMGLTFGAGYDIPINRKISLTPVGNIYYAVLGDISYAGGFLDNSFMTEVQIGLGITFH
jgi:hypothetical protein